MYWSFMLRPGEGCLYERATQSENLREYESEAAMQRYFNFYYGISEIRPCYMMDLQSLQETWRRALVRTGALLEEQFDWQYFKIAGDGVAYKDIIASKLICCEGSTGMENPFFTLLPFSLNKGEAIVLDIPEFCQRIMFTSIRLKSHPGAMVCSGRDLLSTGNLRIQIQAMHTGKRSFINSTDG